MPRRKPSNPTRRNVTGDGIGGLPGPAPGPAQSSPDHPLDGHSSPTASGSGGGLPSDVDVDTGGEIMPERGAGEESFFAVEEEEEGEGREHVEVAPRSSRRKRHKMDHGERERRSLVGGQIVGSRSLPLHPLGALKEMRGLRIVVPPPPGRAVFARNARTARFAVADEDDGDDEKEDDNGDGDVANGVDRSGGASQPKPASGELELGVFVEFSGGWEAVEGPQAARAGMLVRMDPEVFRAVEDLDHGDYIAVSAVKPGRTPLATRPPSSSVAPAVSVSSSWPTALEFHLLSKASGGDGPRPANVPKWQLLFAWLFPTAVEGFYRRPAGGGHRGGGAAKEDEPPPSAAEILHALDAARSTDPDLHAAIQRPDGPIPELQELVVDLRHHQKAAIHWMLGIEQEEDGAMTARGDARDTGEPAAAAAAAAEASERAAFLLGWVRLALTPPTGGDSSLQGEGLRSITGSPGCNANINGAGGVDEGGAIEERGGRTRAQDERAGQVNNGKGRSGTTRGQTQAVSSLLGANGEGQGRTGERRPGVLPAGPGHVWFHVPSARLVEELPVGWVAFSGISGGILADEMGLGKTVEMLGCILANPYRLPSGGGGCSSDNEKVDPRGRGEEVGVDTSQSTQTSRSGYWDDLTPTDEGSACVCGRGDDEPLSEGDLCFVQCGSCGWWLHGGCCGFAPSPEEEADERTFTCVVCSCNALLKSPKPCGSTLIICPHKIRSQWEMEIRARTKAGALKVAVYNGVREIVALGHKSKLASSRRRLRNAKRRRSAEANGSGSTSTSRQKKANNTGSRGRAVETEDQQQQDEGEHDSLRDQQGQEGTRPERGGETPTFGAEGRVSSGSGAPNDAGVSVEAASGPEEGKSAVGETTTAPVSSSVSNGGSGSGGSGIVEAAGDPDENISAVGETVTAEVPSNVSNGGDSGGGSGGSGGDADDNDNDPFALLSPDKLATFDIVLTTFEVLRAEVHHAESKFADILGNGGGAAASRPSLRRKKRYRVIPSPLPALQWWRVVVDEAHMVESTTQETAKMALKIPARHRWCVTGTPIGKGSIDDLYGLLVFLKASPLDSKAVWEKAVREPIDRRLPGAMERLTVALKRVMWRVTKASVAAQINIPPQTCVDRRLSFSSVEEHFYRKQHRAAAADAQKTAREGGRGTEEKMFNSLLALRQACCHPCIGSGGIETSGGGSRLGGGIAGAGGGNGGAGGGQGRWLSMDQILDRLIDEERLKAEEAQRKAILNLNASGAVARLILEAQERRKDAGGAGSSGPAEGGGGGGEGEPREQETPDTLLRDSVACYRRALKMAENNRTPGPVTGGAEVTGSRTMLPPALKRRQSAGDAGASSSARAAAKTGGGGAAGAAAAASAAPAAVFMELRKPLVLSWDVDLAPTVSADAEGGRPAGDVMEAEVATVAVGAAEGAAAASVEGEGGVGIGVGLANGAEREASLSLGVEGGEGEFGERKHQGDHHHRGHGVAGAAGEGRSGARGDRKQEGRLVEGFEFARPRGPAWARLVFADRKRVLRIRVRCSRNEDEHEHERDSLDSLTGGGERSNEPSQAEVSANTVDQPARDELKPRSNVTGATPAAAAAAAELMPAAPDRVSGGKAGGTHRRGVRMPVCYPRVCVLQASPQAGGTFEDVVRFSVEPPPPTGGAEPRERTGGDDGGGVDGRHSWQEVAVPPNGTARGREWRVVVETCQVLRRAVVGAAGATGLEGRRRGGGGGARRMKVGMEVELREAEVDADSLQMLHAAHNLLEVLDHAKERQLPAREVSPEQTLELKQLVDGIKASYVAASVGIHRSSRLQLEEAGRASAEALEAAARKRIGGLEWWEVALRYMESTRDEGNFVQRAQLELLHEKAGQHTIMVRRSFPAFESIGGLRMALSIKIKEAQTKRKGVLRKLEALSTEPGPMEVHSNSSCRRCRADWGKTGPICGHCKVEESIDAWEACVVYFRRPLKNTGTSAGGGASSFTPALGGLGREGNEGPGVNNAHQGHTFKEPSATPRLLRLIQRWIKEQARVEAAGGGALTLRNPGQGEAKDWTALGAESKDFLASWEASERELLSSRALWRAHLDLLSSIDELASCVTPLRLADTGEERLDLLTEDQRRMVLSEGVLGIRRREYELERQAAAHDLESSRGQLAYLSTLVKEGSGSSSGSTRECTVCQEDLVEEVAVLPCGHTFHPECVGFLQKAGFGGRFRCPTCRRSWGSSDVRFASTLDQSDGSASGLPVKGSWGTKITALVGDILALGPSDKCLVFSQWDDMLDIVELAFKENQVSYARMKGKKRSELALEAFRAEQGPRALMLPIKTGSHGLNLVEANHVFLLEPLLNAAVEAQAVNRVHRGGQTRPTTIHRFVVRGTIEEDIERLRKKKLSLSRLANAPQSPTNKSRGKSGKGKGKGKCSSPVLRPAAIIAARRLADDAAVAVAQNAEEEGVAADGGNSTTGNPTATEEHHPWRRGGRGGGGGGGASMQSERLQEGQELGEEEEEEEEEREGKGEGDLEGADQLEEEEIAGLLVGGATAAASERRALSLDDLKALFR